MDTELLNKTAEEFFADFCDSQTVEYDILTRKKITGNFHYLNHEGFDYKIPVQHNNDSHLLKSFYFEYVGQKIGTQTVNFLFVN